MTAQSRPDPRKALIGAVHAEAARAGIDEETRRDIIERVTGKRSSKDLSVQELGRVLDAMKGRAVGRRGTGRHLADTPHARKIRALWLSLHALGAVDDPSEAALAGFAKRQCRIDALQWISAADTTVVIEALKAWCQRSGYDPKAYRSDFAGPMEGRFEPDLIDAQWKLLGDLGAFKSGGGQLDAWLSGQCGGKAKVFLLEPAEAMGVVRKLGAWVRRLKGMPDG